MHLCRRCAIRRHENNDVANRAGQHASPRHRFADADAITEITDKYVRTTAASASDLPVPDAPPVYRPNEDAFEKTSLVERVKDAFGDEKPGWKKQKDS